MEIMMTYGDNDLADVPMTGVKLPGEFKDLDVGKYICRIEDAKKTAVKDKFDASGAPHPDNGKHFYLGIKTKVYGGPDDGHEETDALNLWNANPDAVRIAKSTLLAYQTATNVHTTKSSDLIGKWFVLEVYTNRVGKPAKKFEAIPASWVPANIEPPAALANAPAAAPAPAPYTPPAPAQPVQAPAAYAPAPAPQPAPAPAAPAAGSPSAVPDWAVRKQ